MRRLLRLRRDGRRGNAMTEYLILLVAIAIFVLTAVVEYGNEVESEWGGADQDPAWDAIAENLEGGADGAGSDSPCPYYYNASPGRWHDPATHLFVTFDEAGGAGCS